MFSIVFGFLNKRNYLKNYLIAFVTFFILTSPYLIENYTKFNKHIFFNVNSEFYIWADSWDEIVEGVRANNDRIGWPTMDENELPSLSKYIAEHTISDVYERFLFGFKSIGADYFSPNKLGSHVSFASIAIILLILYFARREKGYFPFKTNLSRYYYNSHSRFYSCFNSFL